MECIKEYENCLKKLFVEDLDIKKSIQLKLDNLSKSEMQLDNLKYNEIYLSCPKNFNDPFDSKPLFDDDKILEFCKKYHKYFNCDANHLYDICQKMRNEIETRMINDKRQVFVKECRLMQIFQGNILMP